MRYLTLQSLICNQDMHRTVLDHCKLEKIAAALQFNTEHISLCTNKIGSVLKPHDTLLQTSRAVSYFKTCKDRNATKTIVLHINSNN